MRNKNKYIQYTQKIKNLTPVLFTYYCGNGKCGYDNNIITFMNKETIDRYTKCGYNVYKNTSKNERFNYFWIASDDIIDSGLSKNIDGLKNKFEKLVDKLLVEDFESAFDIAADFGWKIEECQITAKYELND